jgi:hypothetical protein
MIEAGRYGNVLNLCQNYVIRITAAARYESERPGASTNQLTVKSVSLCINFVFASDAMRKICLIFDNALSKLFLLLHTLPSVKTAIYMLTLLNGNEVVAGGFRWYGHCLRLNPARDETCSEGLLLSAAEAAELQGVH